jgi:hypothetical protein
MGLGYCPLTGSSVPPSAPQGTLAAVQAANTLMVAGYFFNFNGSQSSLCAWLNIPTSFTSDELAHFRLR